MNKAGYREPMAGAVPGQNRSKSELVAGLLIEIAVWIVGGIGLFVAGFLVGFQGC